MSGPLPNHDTVGTRCRKREQKVRNSCNACGAQKIRCSKERPKCHACAVKGICCVYSMSRRTGERLPTMEADSRTIGSTYTSQASGQTLTPVRTPSSNESMTPMPSESSAPTGRPPSIDHQHAHGDVQDDIVWMLDSTFDSHVHDNLHDFGTGTHGSTDAARNSPPGHFNMLSIPEFETFQLLTGSYTPAPYTEQCEAAALQAKRPECAMSGETSSTASPRSRNSESRPGRTSDCASVALALVVDFHITARGCLTADKDVAGRADREYDIVDTHDIETVLSRNREAVKKLNSILDCQCSRTREVLVTIYLAISKAIRWYAGILGNDSNACEDQASAALFGRIVTKPVFMGSYCLDTQASRIVSAHIVLTQIKEHVAPLVKRLECRRSSASSESAMSSTSPPSLGRNLGPDCLIECHHQVLQEQLSRLTTRAAAVGRADT